MHTMPKFVALLRGIGPGTPEMRNDKLRGVFEYLGFTNVQTVLSSGNVIFEYWMKSKSALEWHIERIIEEKLGFKTTAIVKNKREIITLLQSKIFQGKEDSVKSKFNVTFIQKPSQVKERVEKIYGAGYTIVGVVDSIVCSMVDQTAHATPQFMTDLEKEFGTQITTRTWTTMNRIGSRLD